MEYVIVASVLLLFLLFLGWNAFLWGYHDKHTEPVEPQLQRVFDERCLPIELVHTPASGKALIMVHGFPSTPHSYRYAAQRAFEAGYDVFAPLLPGFGTQPEDLYGTSFTQWYGYLVRVYREKRAAYRFLGVVGTSMGGAMTLRIGEDFCGKPEAPDALITVAAPVFLNNLRLRTVKRWNLYVMRTAALFIPALKADIYRGGTQVNDGDELWIGYRGLFIRGGLSLMKALQPIKRNLGRITCPLLCFHDTGDKTVPYRNLGFITTHVRALPCIERTVHMTASHNKHCLLMYRSVQKDLTDEILDFCGKADHTLQKE